MRLLDLPHEIMMAEEKRKVLVGFVAMKSMKSYPKVGDSPTIEYRIGYSLRYFTLPCFTLPTYLTLLYFNVGKVLKLYL